MAKRFAFVDESDWNDGPFCVHAGWLASDPVWQRFEEKWRAILESKGVAEEGFHAKDFFNRDKWYAQRPESTNPYKDWSPEEADEFINQLAQTISGHNLLPLGCAVDVAAFRHLHWQSGGI